MTSISKFTHLSSLLILLLPYSYALLFRRLPLAHHVRVAATAITPISHYSRHSATKALQSSTHNEATKTFEPLPRCAVYHVSDLKKSVEFYKKAMGMRTTIMTDKEATLDFDEEATQPSILLLQSLDSGSGRQVQIGDGFYGLGVHTPAAGAVMSSAETFGGKIVTPLDNYAYGASLIPDEDDLKTFPVRYGRITDPDGYVIEVTETMRQCGSFAKFMLNVIDLDETITFYEKVLGCKLLRKRSNVNSTPKDASMVAFMGSSNQENEIEGPFIELIYNYSTEVLDMGTGFNRIELCVGDLNKIRKRITANGHAIISDTGNAIEVRDPNNYIVLLK